MGNLCRNLEDSTLPKLRKCSGCSAVHHHTKLTYFSNCSHCLCQICLEQEGVGSLKCPLSHKEQRKKDIQLTPKSNISSQKCSNNHNMVWKAQFQTCSQCSKSSHGFRCRICNSSICTTCSSNIDPSSHKCPNQHQMNWRSAGLPCFICNVRSHGWSCKQCSWHACSKCSDTLYSSGSCPNGDKLVWKSTKQPCVICKNTERCYYCQPCFAAFCIRCIDFEYIRDKCPNNHPTKLTNKNNCSKCGLEMSGMTCQTCRYHFCTKCDLEKYSSTTKKMTSIKNQIITVQNPLLALEEGETKQQFSDTMKLAIQKVNNRFHEFKHTGIDTTDSLRQQILQNPDNIELYEKLADLYKNKQTYTNEISTYEEGLEAELNKERSDPMVVYRVASKAYERSATLKYRKYSLIFITKLIELAEANPNLTILTSNLEKWKINRIEHLIANKQIPKANQQFALIKESKSNKQEYKRVKALIKQGAN